MDHMTQPATNQPFASHPASIDAYIRHGWKLVPIPFGTKGPSTAGWNRVENCIHQPGLVPHGHGIGLAHAYSGTMALDIDAWDDAAAALILHGVDLNALYAAPDAVIIDSGRAGHGKLLYAMPFGLALSSKKISTDGTTIYELRCGTANGLTVQDVLPPSIHPETQQPYRWAGNGNWTRLPTIPQPLLDYWMALLEHDKRKVLDASGTSVSWQEVSSALEFISPEVSREEWIHVGMALKHAANQTGEHDVGLSIWNEWSKGSAQKYPGERAIITQWNSFRSDKNSLVTLGTLFHMARKAGWERPRPSVTELFSSVEASSPEQLAKSLRPPAPDVDLDLFPKVLATRALEVSESIGCDPLVPLWSGVAAVCGAMDARTRLELMPGFQVPPVLWIMTVGEPADKKTPGSIPMLKPLHAIEADDRPRYAQEVLAYEGREAHYAAAKKAFIDYHASTEGMLDPASAPHVPDVPSHPVALKILVQDITSQKLVRQAADRPRGLLCHLDEMASWAHKVCDKRSGEDRSSWTQAYEAAWYEMDRVGAGTITCDNYAVAIFGNMQPRVFVENLSSLAADGLIQRFIPVALRGDKTRLGHPIPDHLTNLKEYEQMLRMVFALPGLTYKLCPDAYRRFRDFQQWYEDTKRDERLLNASDIFMTAFGKLEGLTGRMALILHAMTDPYSIEVSEETMERAIAIVRSYIIPSLRYAYSTLGGLADDSLDQWVTDYVLRICGDEAEVDLRRMVRAAKANLTRFTSYQADQVVMDSMIGLEQCGWVARVEDKPHTRHVVWAINPNLQKMFEAHRVAIIKAKQRRLDLMYERGPQFPKFKGRKFVPQYDPETMGG